jgi:hypothetical protein
LKNPEKIPQEKNVHTRNIFHHPLLLSAFERARAMFMKCNTGVYVEERERKICDIKKTHRGDVKGKERRKKQTIASERNDADIVFIKMASFFFCCLLFVVAITKELKN